MLNFLDSIVHFFLDLGIFTGFWEFLHSLIAGAVH